MLTSDDSKTTIFGSNMEKAYTPLDEYRPQIRLLELLPGVVDAEIECELHITSLDDSPQYEAVSYTWGRPTRDKAIKLTGSLVPLGDNLFSILRHLRYPDRPRTIWVDALCINQDDVEEKKGQVQIMARIYSECEQCLIWLGEIPNIIDPGTDICTDDVKLLFGLLRLIAEEDPEVFPEALSNRDLVRKAAHAMEWWMSLGNNEWWLRIWTVQVLGTRGAPVEPNPRLLMRFHQEAVLAPQKTLMWGAVSISWDTCAQAASNMVEPSEQHEHIISALAPEFSYHILNPFTASIIGVELTEDEAWHTPLSTLHRWRHRKSSDPRDKVYGLMGLFDSSDLPSIKCDYTVSAAEVFTDLTLDLFRLTGSLLPLIGWRGELHATPGLPTWALDMVRPPDDIDTGWFRYWWHLPRVRAFKADNYMPLSFDISIDRSTLTLRGLPVDVIHIVDPGIAVGNHGKEVDIGESTIEIIKRREKLLSDFMTNQQNGLPKSEKYIGGGSWRNAFWRTMLGDLVIEEDEHSGYIPRPSDRQEFDDFLNDGAWNEVRSSILNMIQNQAFFITKKGYIGIGPGNLKIGDEAWVLLGGRLPFILRPVVEGKGEPELGASVCTFVGDAHVQGVMYGKLLRAGKERIQDISLR